jgi:hypothetical protein
MMRWYSMDTASCGAVRQVTRGPLHRQAPRPGWNTRFRTATVQAAAAAESRLAIGIVNQNVLPLPGLLVTPI